LNDPTLATLAAKYEKTPAQIVLRWHIELGLVAIPKSANPVRIAQNIDIFDFTLTDDEVASITMLDTGEQQRADSDTGGH
jgi:2,5-diketo-D-gluconate reductase A